MKTAIKFGKITSLIAYATMNKNTAASKKPEYPKKLSTVETSTSPLTRRLALMNKCKMPRHAFQSTKARNTWRRTFTRHLKNTVERNQINTVV